MMIEHMRIGGESPVRSVLTTRLLADDCRDQDVMHGAAEESRLDRQVERSCAARNLRVEFYECR